MRQKSVIFFKKKSKVIGSILIIFYLSCFILFFILTLDAIAYKNVRATCHMMFPLMGIFAILLWTELGASSQKPRIILAIRNDGIHYYPIYHQDLLEKFPIHVVFPWACIHHIGPSTWWQKLNYGNRFCFLLEFHSTKQLLNCQKNPYARQYLKRRIYWGNSFNISTIGMGISSNKIIKLIQDRRTKNSDTRRIY